MARHPARLSLDEQQYQTLVELAQHQQRTVPDLAGELIDLGLQHFQEHRSRKPEALAHLGSLRRVLLTRIGPVAQEPIAEARLAREQQRDEVFRQVRALGIEWAHDITETG
jgi:hypothetical protein